MSATLFTIEYTEKTMLFHLTAQLTQLRSPQQQQAAASLAFHHICSVMFTDDPGIWEEVS